jgi:hypothetical protein
MAGWDFDLSVRQRVQQIPYVDPEWLKLPEYLTWDYPSSRAYRNTRKFRGLESRLHRNNGVVLKLSAGEPWPSIAEDMNLSISGAKLRATKALSDPLAYLMFVMTEIAESRPG